MAQPPGILMEGTAFLSLNDAEESLKYYAFQYGFQIRREHAKQYAQGPFKGQIKRLVFKCSRAGDHRPRSTVTTGRDENPSSRVTINACASDKSEFDDEDPAKEPIQTGCNTGTLEGVSDWQQQAPTIMGHFDVFEMDKMLGKRRRKTRFSSKCNCPWRVNVNFNQLERAWKITSINNVHNHEMIQRGHSVDGDATSTRIAESEVILTLQNNMRLKAIRARMDNYHPGGLMEDRHIADLTRSYPFVSEEMHSCMNDSEYYGLSSAFHSVSSGPITELSSRSRKTPRQLGNGYPVLLQGRRVHENPPILTGRHDIP
jgi:hypothetical protein